MTKRPRGMAMLVVLILLTVMLMGGLALARMTETSTLASGNAAFREASMQAAEVGLNTAFMQTRAIPAVDENTSVAPWYWSTMQAADAGGIPNVNFDTAPAVVVGSYTVRYVVERMCDTATLTDALQQCLVKHIPQLESSDPLKEKIDPPNSRQFRITVRVNGPKDTQTWAQMLITKG
jgi:type IV pilus assembly protein PilX